DFPITDPPGLGGATDRLDSFLDHVVAEHNLDLHLGEKIDHIFGSAIKLGVSFLASKPLRLRDSDALQPDLLQRLLHLVEFEGLDPRFDLLHRVSSPGSPRAAPPAAPRQRLAGSMPSPPSPKNLASISRLASLHRVDLLLPSIAEIRV